MQIISIYNFRLKTRKKYLLSAGRIWGRIEFYKIVAQMGRAALASISEAILWTPERAEQAEGVRAPSFQSLTLHFQPGT